MFREYRIGGVDADMIAGFAIAAEDGGLHDCSLKKGSANAGRRSHSAGQRRGVGAVYRLMGRKAKAETIRAARAEDGKI